LERSSTNGFPFQGSTGQPTSSECFFPILLLHLERLFDSTEFSSVLCKVAMHIGLLNEHDEEWIDGVVSEDVGAVLRWISVRKNGAMNEVGVGGKIDFRSSRIGRVEDHDVRVSNDNTSSQDSAETTGVRVRPRQRLLHSGGGVVRSAVHLLQVHAAGQDLAGLAGGVPATLKVGARVATVGDVP